MSKGVLPKIAVTVLVLAALSVFFSVQASPVAAYTSSPNWCYGYSGGYYYNATYPYYYYGYPYYYYYYYGYPYYYYYSYPYTTCYYGSYYGSYYYYDYGYYGYYSQPSKYQLTVSTDPSDVGTVSGGGSYSSGSQASFSVTQTTIQVSPNTRYMFSHWSGDYSGVGSSGTITMNGARKVVAVYQLQYLLTVNVQPQSAPAPQGTGWYNAGDTVALNVANQMLNNGDASRLVFQGWSLDGNAVQNTGSLSVKMDAPHTASAQYKQQYYLKVLTGQGLGYGEGWYDAGSTAQIYASTPTSTSYGVSYVFNGWQGDVQSPSQSTTVLMDKPKTAIASWGTDSTILNLTIALGIIAAFLIVAGIVAIIALSRNRNRQQVMYVQPGRVTSGPYSPPPGEGDTVRKKLVPVKKKPPETDTESESTMEQ